jgi:hypothetical protein
MPSIQVPTLFLSGLADNLIPPRMMKSLHSVSINKIVVVQPALIIFVIVKCILILMIIFLEQFAT